MPAEAGDARSRQTSFSESTNAAPTTIHSRRNSRIFGSMQDLVTNSLSYLGRRSTISAIDENPLSALSNPTNPLVMALDEPENIHTRDDDHTMNAEEEKEHETNLTILALHKHKFKVEQELKQEMRKQQIYFEKQIRVARGELPPTELDPQYQAESRDEREKRSQRTLDSLRKSAFEATVARAIVTFILGNYQAMEYHAKKAAHISSPLNQILLYEQCHYIIGVALFHQKAYGEAHVAFKQAMNRNIGVSGISNSTPGEWLKAVSRAIEDSALQTSDQTLSPTFTATSFSATSSARPMSSGRASTQPSALGQQQITNASPSEDSSMALNGKKATKLETSPYPANQVQRKPTPEDAMKLAKETTSSPSPPPEVDDALARARTQRIKVRPSKPPPSHPAASVRRSAASRASHSHQLRRKAITNASRSRNMEAAYASPASPSSPSTNTPNPPAGAAVYDSPTSTPPSNRLPAVTQPTEPPSSAPSPTLDESEVNDLFGGVRGGFFDMTPPTPSDPSRQNSTASSPILPSSPTNHIETSDSDGSSSMDESPPNAGSEARGNGESVAVHGGREGLAEDAMAQRGPRAEDEEEEEEEEGEEATYEEQEWERRRRMRERERRRMSRHEEREEEDEEA